MSQDKLQAYAQTQKSSMSSREIEAMAFTKAALMLDEAAQSWWGLFRNELGWTEGTVFQIEDNQIVLSTREHPQHRCDHPLQIVEHTGEIPF